MNKRAATISILDAIDDPKLFAPWFKDRATWSAWLVFLSVLFGLELNAGDLGLFRQCTGLVAPPEGGVREAWLVCGRRAGKSFVLALIAVYLACFRDWRPYMQPGERGTIVVVAADRKQARTIYRYAHALLTKVALLRPLAVRDTSEQIDLANGVTIEILTANFRTVRGYTVVAALLDEVAFWHAEDSANPDAEIVAALRPAMATVPGAMLLCASSPYARRGVLWEATRKHYGEPGPALVWKADTRTMNPTVPETLIAEAYAEDPARASAEYGAEFRVDIEAFVSQEIVRACLGDYFEAAPREGCRYVAFADPSGGSADSFTMAIAHRDDQRIVVDATREVKPPFSPESVVDDFSILLKTYRISKVTGDRYAGEWPREQFRKRGISYDCAEKPKSDLFRDLLPLLNSGRIVLPKSDRLVNQLCGLERRVSRSGRDSIDHGPGGHDDLGNAVAGAADLVATGKAPMMISAAALKRLTASEVSMFHF